MSDGDVASPSPRTEHLLSEQENKDCLGNATCGAPKARNNCGD